MFLRIAIALLGFASVCLPILFWMSSHPSPLTPPENPSGFRVLIEEGPYQIRVDSPLTVVQCPRRDDPACDARIRLDRYLRGANATGERIPPGGPVRVTRHVAEVPLPKDVSLQGAPPPAELEVRIARHDHRLYAVHRFSAPASEPDRAAEAERDLRNWVASTGLPLVPGEAVIVDPEKPGQGKKILLPLHAEPGRDATATRPWAVR